MQADEGRRWINGEAALGGLLGVVRGRGDLAASGGWLIAAGLVLLGHRSMVASRP